MFLRALLNQWMQQNAKSTVQEFVRERLAGATRSRAPDNEPLPPCELAITFALSMEAGGFVDLLEDVVTTRCQRFIEHVGNLNGRRIVIGETGVGSVNAYEATTDLLAMHRPRWLVTSGFAGGMTDALARNHLLLATEVVDERGEVVSLGGAWGTGPAGVHVGRLLTVERVIRTPQEKRDLAARWGACACDMETASVLRACREQSTQAVAVRIITDTVEDQLPVEIESIVERKSLAQKLGAVTGAVLRRPSSIKDMWELRERALIASDRLAKFLVGVIQLLP